MELSSLETRYVDVPVTAPAGVTITDDTVQVAFIARGKPDTGDWKNAAWATSSTGQTVVRILVGPGSSPLLTLDVGTWYEWVKITDSPEIPVFLAGSVTVT